MCHSKDAAVKKRIYKEFTSRCVSLLWHMPLLSSTAKVMASLANRRTSFRNRPLEILLHRQTHPDIVMGATQGRI